MRRLGGKTVPVLFLAFWVFWGQSEGKPGQHAGIPRLTLRAASAEETGLKAGMIDPKTGKRIKYWVAPMDPTYVRNEPGKSPMGMDLVPVYEEEGGAKEPASVIRIDPVTVQNMGVRFAQVKRGTLVRNIKSFGAITYNEKNIYTVNTKFSGWIERLYVNFVGDSVKKGQPLFDIYSPQLVSAQEEFLLAAQQCADLCDSPYPSVREGARRLIEASRTRLRYWDLTEEQINRIQTTGRIKKALTVYSPASGIVIEKAAFQGHFVKDGEHQYVLADLSTVWVDVEVYDYELPWISPGMPAEMDLSYIPGKRYQGKVLYVYPFLQEKTRTAKLRLTFANPGGELKPGMYANIYLRSTVAKEGLVIPQEAVIDSGMRKVVFVSLGDGRFEAREVQIGAEGNHNEYQVLAGLKEGETIVTSAQFMLDSESRLREAIQKMTESPGKPGSMEQTGPAGAMKMEMPPPGQKPIESTQPGGEMNMAAPPPKQESMTPAQPGAMQMPPAPPEPAGEMKMEGMDSHGDSKGASDHRH